MSGIGEADSVLIHETVHAYDDIKDVNFRPYSFAAGYLYGTPYINIIESSTEGLAYGTANGALYQFGIDLIKFEKDLKARAFKSQMEMNKAWRDLWVFAPLGHTPVYTDGNDPRKLNQSDVDAIKNHFGIDLDPIRLTNLYQQLAYSQYNAYLEAPDTVKVYADDRRLQMSQH